MTVELRLRTGASLSSPRTLAEGDYSLGRDASCDVVIEAPGVADRHAKLRVLASQVSIEPIGAAEVIVAGKRIRSPTQIHLPGEVLVGGATLGLALKPAEEGETVEAPPASVPGEEGRLQFLKARNYRLGGEIARGGMGAILSAQDLNLRRQVAVKVLLSGRPGSEESLQRFIREAQVIAQLEHPNIVPLHELAVNANGQVFYVMKLVKGTTLLEVLEGIREGKTAALARYSLAELLTIFQKVCDAVAFAHSRKVVHRDLKPANIMLGEYGEVLVMDWGLAKIMAERDTVTAGLEGWEGASAGADSTFNPLRTRQGRIIGTPSYMAPEQASGRINDIDARTDIYALGGILYHILVLKPPVQGSSLEEIVAKIASGDITSPVRLGQAAMAEAASPARLNSGWPHCPGGRVPDALSAVAMKALSVSSDARYESVQALQQDIAAHQHGYATTAERITPWKLVRLAMKRRRTELTLAAVALAILMVVSAIFVYRMSRTLAELRKAAPSFYAEARSLLEERRLSQALEKVRYAISLDPHVADYFVLKGNIHQTLLEFERSREAYLEALKLDGKHLAASENLLLSQKLLSGSAANSAPPLGQLHALRLAMLSQQRFTEAGLISMRIGKAEGEFLSTWKQKLDHAGFGGLLDTLPDGGLRLSLSNSPVADLGPLRGLPLTALILHECRNVADLSPLKGMPLKRLKVDAASVSDLSPLRGMPLEYLHLTESRGLADLSPLRGMPLQELVLAATNVRDLSPLAGMPLYSLTLFETPVEELSPLRGVALRFLGLQATPVRDLRPIAHSTLTALLLDHCPNLRDLSPLTNCTFLDTLTIPTQAENIEMLRAFPKIIRLGYSVPQFNPSRVTSVEEFWRNFDSGRKAQ